jgi:hypothetical protein
MLWNEQNECTLYMPDNNGAITVVPGCDCVFRISLPATILWYMIAMLKYAYSGEFIFVSGWYGVYLKVFVL